MFFLNFFSYRSETKTTILFSGDCRGVDHRRPPLVPAVSERQAVGSGHERERLGREEQVRQLVRLSRVHHRQLEEDHRHHVWRKAGQKKSFKIKIVKKV